jgi:pimeloyl-ACP methyl ester carboxylesterase
VSQPEPAPAEPAPAESVTVERAYTRCRFGQLHYIHGVPAAPTGKTPLVLLHQNPSSSLEYSALVAEMARDREVIAFDTPGNGMSDRPPEPLAIDGYASAFAEGLAALGLGPATGRQVDVFGFHSGTYYAAELAASRPDLVRRLTLCGVPFRTGDERTTRLDDAINAPPLDEEGESTFAQLRGLWRMVVTGRDPSVPLDRAGAVFAEMVKPMQRASWPYIAVWGYNAAERLPAITVPTLVIAVKDTTYPYTIAAAGLIPGAKLVRADDLGYSVFEVGVGRFAAELRDFLG